MALLTLIVSLFLYDYTLFSCFGGRYVYTGKELTDISIKHAIEKFAVKDQTFDDFVKLHVRDVKEIKNPSFPPEFGVKYQYLIKMRLVNLQGRYSSPSYTQIYVFGNCATLVNEATFSYN